MTDKKTARCSALAAEKVAAVRVEEARASKAIKRAAAVVGKAKPLSNRKSMVNEVEADRDVSDVESAPRIDDDADGVAVSAKIADATDPKTKAKPLRMKVPKARLIKFPGPAIAAFLSE